ncbi:MAG: hypothetical protein AAF316_00235 [Cyanobacteria bacterium P01_A01_bin.80]
MKYGVTVPVFGIAYVEVEADSEDAAWGKACDALSEERLDDMVGEYEFLRKVIEGKVLHCSLERAQFEVLEDEYDGNQ